MRARVAIIVLAAGSGRRFHTDKTDEQASKVIAPIRGIPLVKAVVTTALASDAVSVSVVTGRTHIEILDVLRGLDVEIIHNSDFASGMASSLKAGLARVAADVDGALVLLADMPLVRPETINRLITSFESQKAETQAVVPVHAGQRGNPVLIGRSLFAAVRSLNGDEGARSLIRKPGLVVVFCAVEDPGVIIDIDSREDLKALNEGS